MPPTLFASDLHLSNERLLLFVGRLQPLKGPDIAIRSLADAVARAPDLTRDVVLAVVGGPSGSASAQDEVARLMNLAASAGVGDRVVFFPPQPHERLADFYTAAEAVLVPSHSESFGLVALEAEACGTPVIAAATGGLRYVVVDGHEGRQRIERLAGTEIDVGGHIQGDGRVREVRHGHGQRDKLRDALEMANGDAHVAAPHIRHRRSAAVIRGIHAQEIVLLESYL